jgi:hypothetical protein
VIQLERNPQTSCLNPKRTLSLKRNSKREPLAPVNFLPNASKSVYNHFNPLQRCDEDLLRVKEIFDAARHCAPLTIVQSDACERNEESLTNIDIQQGRSESSKDGTSRTKDHQTGTLIGITEHNPGHYHVF